ncbi:hypothetical protein D7Z54_14445 [Salibacterium salarium]|uniref:Uncharacterized protein n=1 Tax=Salibacterium salarium TaxID=284579 RepID=A0A428N2W8_9BACI|nr:hypothetical protein [Salibacterium salarium]RSL32647.1 hypothetical protein D7Z54_14445 [Salibacterium salarium]
MTVEVTKTHFRIIQLAAEEFDSDPTLTTWRDPHDAFIALRYGPERDSIYLYELGPAIAIFSGQLQEQPFPRQSLWMMAHYMEAQLQVNRHKGNWRKEHHEFLQREMERNSETLKYELSKEDKDKHEITIRCANIANYAMMIADNEGAPL